jgi:MFS family permease
VRLPGALSQRNYLIYWIGQAISLVGVWMQQLAQGQVVVTLTDSKTAVATLAFAGSLPILLLSVVGGVMADRHDRRKILIASQAGLALVAFAYAALVASGHLTMPLVYLMAILLGCITAFDLPAQQALVPELVGREHIASAVAYNQAVFHGARFVGPALATIVIAATSTEMAFVANGVSYFAVITSLLLIKVAPRPHVARKPGAGGLGEAWRYIGDHAVVRALIGYTALTTSLVFPFIMVFLGLFVKSLLPVVNEDTLAKAFGPVMGGSGLGSLLGAVALMQVPSRLRGPLIVYATVVIGCLLGAVSFAQDVWTVAVVTAVMSFHITIGLGLTMTIMQVIVRPDLRGRIMALYSMSFTGLLPVAGLLLGVFADAVDLRTTIRGMAGLYLVLAIAWLLKARLWRTPTDEVRT